jgi:hypothetical protein
VDLLNAAARRAVIAPISAVFVAAAANGPVEQLKMSPAEGWVKVPTPSKVKRLLMTVAVRLPHWAWVSIVNGVLA